MYIYMWASDDYFCATDHASLITKCLWCGYNTASPLVPTQIPHTLLFGMRLLFMHHALILDPPLDNRQSNRPLTFRRWSLTFVWFALTSRALLAQLVVVYWRCCWCYARLIESISLTTVHMFIIPYIDISLFYNQRFEEI